ncbi:hypothetical protein R1flu_022846 [Riccia fluitans]|uniref:AB hydrolase-1 domain-containing protein n=1 Tax=Riccia fluitans TaxID=41844 RepID=A0ABD1XQC8_9MARC
MVMGVISRSKNVLVQRGWAGACWSIRDGQQFWTGKKKNAELQQRAMATLAYDELLVPEKGSFDGMRTVMFMHGLLGSGRNLRTFAKRLASRAQEQSAADFPGWRLIMVDLRNHGRSADRGFTPPHDIPSAAKDVVDLIKTSSFGWPDIVISHSMGGKVALEYSSKAAAGYYGDALQPKQLWVLDTIPGKIPVVNDFGEVEHVLSTIEGLPDPLPSRRWLVDYMLEKGHSRSLAEWLGSNLKRAGSGEEMTWVFNPREATEMLNSHREADYWPVLESPPKDMEIHIVRAVKSVRWLPDVVSRLEKLSNTGKIFYHVLQNAGHWVHVDNPEGLADIIVPSLVKLNKTENNKQ